jgi:hypothetical protein
MILAHLRLILAVEETIESLTDIAALIDAGARGGAQAICYATNL